MSTFEDMTNVGFLGLLQVVVGVDCTVDRLLPRWRIYKTQVYDSRMQIFTWDSKFATDICRQALSEYIPTAARACCAYFVWKKVSILVLMGLEEIAGFGVHWRLALENRALLAAVLISKRALVLWIVWTLCGFETDRCLFIAFTWLWSED